MLSQQLAIAPPTTPLCAGQKVPGLMSKMFAGLANLCRQLIYITTGGGGGKMSGRFVPFCLILLLRSTELTIFGQTCALNIYPKYQEPS